MSEMPEVVQRIEVGLVAEGALSLARLLDSTGMNKADVVNRALQMYEFIESEIRSGNQIIVRAPGGQMKEVNFL